MQIGVGRFRRCSFAKLHTEPEVELHDIMQVQVKKAKRLRYKQSYVALQALVNRTVAYVHIGGSFGLHYVGGSSWWHYMQMSQSMATTIDAGNNFTVKYDKKCENLFSRFTR